MKRANEIYLRLRSAFAEAGELSSRLEWTLWLLLVIFVAGFGLAVRGSTQDTNALKQMRSSDPYDITSNTNDQSPHTRLETGF